MNLLIILSKTDLNTINGILCIVIVVCVFNILRIGRKPKDRLPQDTTPVEVNNVDCQYNYLRKLIANATGQSEFNYCGAMINEFYLRFCCEPGISERVVKLQEYLITAMESEERMVDQLIRNAILDQGVEK